MSIKKYNGSSWSDTKVLKHNGMDMRMPLLENTTALHGIRLAVSYIQILGFAHGHPHTEGMADMV